MAVERGYGSMDATNDCDYIGVYPVVCVLLTKYNSRMM